MKKLPFAYVKFADDKITGVTLIQVFRPDGAIIECESCEANVDVIMDAPLLHHNACSLLRPQV